jgi:outer membrane biosynthesis protein TonB
MTLTFKCAFFASVLIHSAVILPIAELHSEKRFVYEKQQIEVDYVLTQDVQRPSADEGSAALSEKAPAIELERKIELKPVTPAQTNYSEKASRSRKDAARTMGRKIAKIRSTREYLGYYQAIREKIRKRLKANYTNNSDIGDVNIVFTLNSDGSLVSVDTAPAVSPADQALAGVACSSIREAAPFPPFPKAISLPKMAFNLIVSFKRQ